MNQDRWMDFVDLGAALLAAFVVIFAVRSMKAARSRGLDDSMDRARERNSW